MSYIVLFLKGCVIGVANIIPGVSGGTMALVLGIYERLINALHNLGPETVRELLPAITGKREAFLRAQKELQRIDFWFLTTLTIGAAIAVLATAKLITYLIYEQHDPTYGFFCGLILVSVLVPLRMMKSRVTAGNGIGFLLGAILAIALGMSMIGPQQADKAREKVRIRAEQAAGEALEQLTSEGAELTLTRETDYSFPRLCFLFLAGAIAMSAMILPGISGSFMLLVMGAYFDVLAAVDQRDPILIGTLGAGAIIGLLGFTRLLNFVLKRWHDATMALLIGLMIGSLYGLWPFRDFEIVAGEKAYTSLRLPDLGANLWITIAAFLVGGAIVYGFLLLDQKHEKPATEHHG